jgi:hypothetical protein
VDITYVQYPEAADLLASSGHRRSMRCWRKRLRFVMRDSGLLASASPRRRKVNVGPSRE